MMNLRLVLSCVTIFMLSFGIRNISSSSTSNSSDSKPTFYHNSHYARLMMTVIPNNYSKSRTNELMGQLGKSVYLLEMGGHYPNLNGHLLNSEFIGTLYLTWVDPQLNSRNGTEWQTDPDLRNMVLPLSKRPFYIMEHDIDKFENSQGDGIYIKSGKVVQKYTYIHNQFTCWQRVGTIYPHEIYDCEMTYTLSEKSANIKLQCGYIVSHPTDPWIWDCESTDKLITYLQNLHLLSHSKKWTVTRKIIQTNDPPAIKIIYSYEKNYSAKFFWDYASAIFLCLIILIQLNISAQRRRVRFIMALLTLLDAIFLIYMVEMIPAVQRSPRSQCILLVYYRVMTIIQVVIIAANVFYQIIGCGLINFAENADSSANSETKGYLIAMPIWMARIVNYLAGIVFYERIFFKLAAKYSPALKYAAFQTNSEANSSGQGNQNNQSSEIKSRNSNSKFNLDLYLKFNDDLIENNSEIDDRFDKDIKIEQNVPVNEVDITGSAQCLETSTSDWIRLCIVIDRILVIIVLVTFFYLVSHMKF